MKYWMKIFQGFTSAGGSRDSSVKQVCWYEGSLFSGDDAGVICKVRLVTAIICSSSVIQHVAVGRHDEPGVEHQHLH